MVLVQMPNVELARSYHAHVLRPHLIHYPPLRGYHLHSLEITTDLQSPEMSLKGSIVTLAAMLDYPGRLPQSMREFPTMIEVSYWDDAGPTLLTAFAAQKDQLELIRLHFAFYRNAMLKQLDIRLKLQVLDMNLHASQ
ncbi:hypothetical protein DFQ26_008072 [Actinomortierella ambigua]|nr:hypothetical protein DFQ26_008072 [Actinomortierella ambigua]